MVTIDSFKYAIRGLKVVLSNERNARIHLLFACLALLLSLLFRIDLMELLMVIMAIILVFFAEVTNSAIEKTLDLISIENSQVVKLVKDMTAGGVLVTATGAIIVAILVFGPDIIKLFVK